MLKKHYLRGLLLYTLSTFPAVSSGLSFEDFPSCLPKCISRFLPCFSKEKEELISTKESSYEMDIILYTYLLDSQQKQKKINVLFPSGHGHQGIVKTVQRDSPYMFFKVTSYPEEHLLNVEKMIGW